MSIKKFVFCAVICHLFYIKILDTYINKCAKRVRYTNKSASKQKMFEELKIISFDENDDKRVEIIDFAHNSVLNCLLLLTNQRRLLIYDCNTQTLLKQVDWRDTDTPSKILSMNDKCLMLSDQTLCVRTAHDGIFLLESVFQTKFKNLDDTDEFFIELTLNDSIILLHSLKSIEFDPVNGLDAIVKQIDDQVTSYKGKYDQQVCCLSVSLSYQVSSMISFVYLMNS